MWMPGSSPDSAQIAAQRGYTLAAFLCGHAAKATFQSYRSEYERSHGHAAPLDRLAYLGLAVAAESDAEARARAEKLYSYYATVPRSPPGTFNPPGYSSIHANAVSYLQGGQRPFPTVMPDGSPLPANPSLEQLAEAGILFWGKPDQVIRQLDRFSEQVGGLGHFLCMGQGGFLSHEETVSSLTLLGREVYPAFKDMEIAAE